MTINRKQSSEREIKALTIVGLQDQIKRINQRTYKVKSQSSDVWYDVIGSHDGYSCSCCDFIYRHVECKHIKSVYISQQLRNKIVNNSDIKEIENQNDLVCKCGSMQVIKIGIRHNKSGNIQRFKCKKCSHKWSDNLGFANNRVNSKIITMAIDLYFKGVSLRKIKEHIVMFHGVTVSHVAILGWIRKFAEAVAPYVDQFKPELSGVYHVDEMMVHVRKEENGKGHYSWLWNMMDNTTRFWISSKVSQRREVEDARSSFQDAKTRSPMPVALVHDGLQSYNEAYFKEYYLRTGTPVKNIRSVSVRHKGLNQKIERLNGVFRDREKVMRGMDHKESAQKLIDACRIHYNFVREHGSIKRTPSEQAGIKLDLGQNKIETLIKLALKNSKQYARS
jgi:transposase-like protein